MKTICLGDLHGKNIWQKIVEKEKDADRFIFIGDYVDAFDKTGEVQYANLIDLIYFKEKSKKEVIFLIGNHDFQYMDNGLMGEIYSGFQSRMRASFNALFEDNEDLFQICFKDEYETIYSHAGISTAWLELIGLKDYEPKALVPALNEFFITKPSKWGFYGGDREGYGDHVNQSCIWIRPWALSKKALNVKQVVGHTQQEKITFANNTWFIDSLDKTSTYLSCVGGEYKVETL